MGEGENAEAATTVDARIKAEVFILRSVMDVYDIIMTRWSS